MKHTNFFWRELIEDRKFNQLDITTFLTYSIDKIVEEYSFVEDNGLEKDSIIFMDNICHVITIKGLQDFSTSQSKRLLKNLTEHKIKAFLSLIISHSVMYKKAGYSLNYNQLGLVQKFLAFKEYEKLINLDKKRIFLYLKGKRKTLPL